MTFRNLPFKNPKISNHREGKPYNGINIIINSGETTLVEFIADKVGEFDFACSVFCGSGHGRMKGKLVVK